MTAAFLEVIEAVPFPAVPIALTVCGALARGKRGPDRVAGTKITCARARLRYYTADTASHVGGFTQVIGIGLAGLFGISALMLALASRRAPQPSAEDYARTAAWTDEDFVELDRMSKRIRAHSPDLLLVFTSESGLQPTAAYMEDGYPIAVGINQLTEVSNSVTGLTEAQRVALTSKSVAEQLPYVEKYFRGTPWFRAGREFASAGQVYAANAAGSRMMNPDGVLYTPADGSAWEHNKALDFNGDGKITVDDLGNHLGKKAQQTLYQSALARLRYATGIKGLRPNLPEG